MKIFGVVAEYNPFHNGHAYQIKCTREYGATHIVAVMSGNYVQRGDVAVVDKFTRAKLAVHCGCDLVIEIPTPFALASAEHFARGAISILERMGCVDGLSFGSECGDIKALSDTAHIIRKLANSDELLEMLRSGMSYPLAINLLVKQYSIHNNVSTALDVANINCNILGSPNNILGIEYIKALDKFASHIELFTVKRENGMHDSSVSNRGFASASHIRNIIQTTGTVPHEYVPNEIKVTLEQCVKAGNIANISRIDRTILYKLRRMSAEEILQISDVGQGLEHRICSAVEGALDYNELLFAIKTKRYTLSRIRRILLSALLGITKKDIVELPPYARVLAFNQRGVEIMSRCKTTSNIPLDSSLLRLSKGGEHAYSFSKIESSCTDIYNLATEKVSRCGEEFTAKIKIS